MSVCEACNGCGWIDDDEIDETPPPVRVVEIRHSMMCNVPNAGGCFVPSCSCPCHKATA